MKQKISIGLSAVICCLILIVLLFISKAGKSVPIYTSEPADSYDQLELCIKHDSGMERIHIWKTEAEGYYFFLPSYATSGELFWCNLPEGDLIVGEEKYTGKAKVLDLEYNYTYVMQMRVGEEDWSEEKITFVQSENLPAIFIDTESGGTDLIHSDKTVQEGAAMRIVDDLGQTVYADKIDYIRTRGNSTFSEVDKKSYQVKLFNKKSFFGMGEAKKWLLMANAKDDSRIRNALILDYAAAYTQIEAPEGVFADVYLNGNYAGNYYLCEKVEVGKERLDITDLAKQNEQINGEARLKDGQQYISADGKVRAVAGLTNPEDITGGYLLEKIIADEYEAMTSAFISGQGHCFRIVSPEYATVEQVQYIQGLVNEMETAIAQPDGIHPITRKHFSEYMDMESWVSKHLIEEFFNNPDAPSASTFLYKDADAIDAKIYFGPAWDYDRAFGNYAVSLYMFDSPQQIGYRGLYSQQLLKFEEVEAAVLAEYQQKLLVYLEEDLKKQVNKWQSHIQASAAMDKLRWPKTIGYYEEWDANGEYLVSFLEDRAEYLNDIWLNEEEYHTVSFLNYYGEIFDTYQIKHGEYMEQVPEIASFVAIFGGWKNNATGKTLDIRLPVLEDAVYRSEWIGADILLQNGLGMAEMELKDVDIEALEALLEAAKKMQEETNEQSVSP